MSIQNGRKRVCVRRLGMLLLNGSKLHEDQNMKEASLLFMVQHDEGQILKMMSSSSSSRTAASSQGAMCMKAQRKRRG